MREVLDALERWSARGEPVALATVVAVRRSAPRPPGSKMALNGRGEVSGAVSGGCVEGAVVSSAAAVLAGGESQLLQFGIADEEAWDVGLPCGGEIDVLVERYEPDGPQGEFAALVRRGTRAALVCAIEEPAGAGAKLLVNGDGEPRGGLADPRLERGATERAEQMIWLERSGVCEVDGIELFVDVVAPPPRLLVFGAVDFAAELCRMARAAGWLPYVIDPRSGFATRARFPAAERVIAAWPEAALRELGGIDRATYVAVLTHDPKLDDATLLAALDSEAPYIGAMGSRRAQARRRERLLEAGVPERQLARVAAPIGLDLGGLRAEETALSIMAEIVAIRNGREGGRLSAASGRIHEVAG
ncbi:MAG TPA: XdhC family protein [Solirubrobacterales bacterium]|nr:XdhC family protein [Solirubrobacterales bacterium]